MPRAKGKITNLRVEKKRAIVLIEGAPSPARDKWFRLMNGHENFRHCLAVLVGAGINRQRVILAYGTGDADIQYVELEWKT